MHSGKCREEAATTPAAVLLDSKDIQKTTDIGTNTHWSGSNQLEWKNASIAATIQIHEIPCESKKMSHSSPEHGTVTHEEAIQAE